MREPSAYRYNYSPEILALSRTVYQVLVANNRPKRRNCLTYKQMSEMVGMSHWRPLRFVLHKIQDECRSANLPIVTVLVVRAGQGIPGQGCDAHNPGDFADTLLAVAETDWPADPWW